MIKYDKMLKLLADKGYNASRIRKESIMGQRTYYAIKRGSEDCSIATIDKLCKTLKCQPGDLIEYVPDDDTFETCELCGNDTLSREICTMDIDKDKSIRVCGSCGAFIRRQVGHLLDCHYGISIPNRNYCRDDMITATRIVFDRCKHMIKRNQ